MADARPPVWVGHVTLHTTDLDASEAFLETIGMRKIFRGDTVAVLELRGGTHVVVLPDGEVPERAGFDLMVEDLDATWADYEARGFAVSAIERGDIHDSFHVTEPGGNRIVVNSTHVPDHELV